jgi:NTP pyrophosphatase (non-canonical NTP hydrolase)
MIPQTDYSSLVHNLAKPGKEIQEALTPEQAAAWHMATGISGEAGELLDAIKKYAIYQKKIDIENVIEELGDLEFYMEGLRQVFDIKREDVLVHNFNKLNKRYHQGKYSDQQAQERKDKNG